MLLDIIFRGMFRSVTSLCRAAPSTLRSLSSAASPPASVWSLGKLNHVAVAVPNLKAATSLYRDMFGATVSPGINYDLNPTFTVKGHLGPVRCITTGRY